ncbi:MAG TPA: RNA polymerase sigma factor SigJ [Longimicrobiales bacterium]|nr:RNA polymerase sigma factor SigJ [Longimicrobiales bacterium]
MDSGDATSALLQELRPNALAIAYRMLGSVSDAEDVVQEGLLRLHAALDRGDEIDSPGAYLATVVTRLCIDELRSARLRRERYVGEWLPEPVVGTAAEELAGQPDFSARPELLDSLGMAFLVLLETLTPEQRAVLLLRDVFDYGYDEVARILGKSEVACRQIAVRARARVLERRPRFDVRPEQQEELAERFFSAVEHGELDALEALLAEEVSLHGDGGGKVPALARALHGRSTVARTLLHWRHNAERAGGFRFERTRVNGQPGALIRSAEGALVGVWSIDLAEGRVAAIRSIVNPDKLRHLGSTLDLGSWLRRGEHRG